MTPECTYCRNPAPYHIFDDDPICSDCLRKEINSQKKLHPLDLLTSEDHTTLDILQAINVTAPTPEHFTQVLKLRKEAKENTLTTSDQLEQLRQISLLPQETIESIAIRWKEFYCTFIDPSIPHDDSMQSFIEDIEYADPLSEQGNCILEVRASESIDGTPHQFKFIKP